LATAAERGRHAQSPSSSSYVVASSSYPSSYIHTETPARRAARRTKNLVSRTWREEREGQDPRVYIERGGGGGVLDARGAGPSKGRVARKQACKQTGLGRAGRGGGGRGEHCT
jgi:hypothetical protein